MEERGELIRLAVSIAVAVYVYYMLTRFETTFNVQHALERWIQRRCAPHALLSCLRHGASPSHRVCQFGRWVGELIALWLVARFALTACDRRERVSLMVWALNMSGAAVVNLNAFAYLLPACAIDVYYSARCPSYETKVGNQ